MRARYYDPALGRFISEDLGCNGVNWYAYCSGNPVNAVDENGRVEMGALAGGLDLGVVVGESIALAEFAVVARTARDPMVVERAYEALMEMFEVANTGGDLLALTGIADMIGDAAQGRFAEALAADALLTALAGAHIAMYVEAYADLVGFYENMDDNPY